jgi:ferric-dicitrate binding protein FerR (iron transport regulator)
MKKSIHSLFIAAIVSLTVVCVQAAETASEVVVLKVKGAATAVLPGSTAPVEVKAGSMLPQGAVIETPAGSQVQLQVFPGIVTTIEAGSKVDLSKLSLTTSQGVVTKQSAVIGLKVGSVVSKLDPSKKSINDYSVSTPKGVAAARGTVYKVVVTASGEVRLYVSEGTVKFTKDGTTNSVDVPAGSYVVVDANGNLGDVQVGSENDVSASADETKNKAAKQLIDTTIVVSPSAP